MSEEIIIKFVPLDNTSFGVQIFPEENVELYVALEMCVADSAELSGDVELRTECRKEMPKGAFSYLSPEQTCEDEKTHLCNSLRLYGS